MDPITLSILAGTTVAGIGNDIYQGDKNRQAAKDAEKRARAEREAIKALYDGIEQPEFAKTQYEDTEYVGDIDPRFATQAANVGYTNADTALMNSVNQGDSRLEGINVDPRLKQAQMDALMQMQGIAASGGMTAADTANLSKIQSQSAQADKGRREAILQNMAARGMAGSGNELLAQLQSSQAATDRQSQEGLDIAGMAQRRALEAMMQGGQLGGSIRGQEFGEQARVAEAQDSINRFNAANQNSANQYNAGATNSMNQFNTGNKLRTDMYNTDNTNQFSRENANTYNDASKYNNTNKQNNINLNTSVRNRGLDRDVDNQQQTFNNKKSIVDGKSGQSSAGYWDSRATPTERDTFGKVIDVAGKVGAAYASKKDDKEPVP
jgi:hypothetical protein